MSEDQDYILDIAGLSDEPNAGGGGNTNAAETDGVSETGESGETGGRPWIGIQFECCGVYTRIYRNREGTAYEGHCPRCTRQVKVRVGAGGTSQRMFKAQ